MKEIVFITGNQGKLNEVSGMIPGIRGIDMDLPEIQALDASPIIAAKLAEAQKNHMGPCIVEDTSLYLDAMNGLPGPFIKWFIKAIGIEGVFKLTETFESARATARTLIGYADENGTITFFSGSISGSVVAPRGTDGFGWDPIFQPDGSEKTFAEMTPEGKNQYSMRKIAVEELRKYIEQKEEERAAAEASQFV